METDCICRHDGGAQRESEGRGKKNNYLYQPFVSKVLERVVAQRLTSYMTDNNLHEYLQSAYKPGHSTETALVKVQNDILTSIDQHGIVILILLDLSAAFDTIDHDVLFSRMESTVTVLFEFR